MRKATAQRIRDRWGKEVSRTFLAHADEDVQDTNYTRPSVDKVEQALRALYPEMKEMFRPIAPQEVDAVIERVKKANRIAKPGAGAAA